MRIKYGNYIKTVEEVKIREEVGDIWADGYYYRTGDNTSAIGEQLLKNGYADLSSYSRC